MTKLSDTQAIILSRASKTGRPLRSAVPEALARTEPYKASQRARKRIEEVFGWIKQSAGLRQTRHQGSGHVRAAFSVAATDYDVPRLSKLLHHAHA